MIREEKLQYLLKNYLDLYVATRVKVEKQFSDAQGIWCCCGHVATERHERSCRRFQERVTDEVLKRLSHLLPQSFNGDVFQGINFNKRKKK